jgi:hypothetical protein
MVNVAYSADVDHIDEPLTEAADERPDQPIRIRLQPSIFRKAGSAQGQHRAWQGVSWTLECRDVEEAAALREAMRVFFEAVGERGPEAVAAWIQSGETHGETQG